MKWAYYQDIDEEKCEWVCELIKAGVVTDGEVDCRDIKLVTADDVRGFRRVHCFAGIAVWDYALNLAGWGDRPVWTGSCPCQSFSSAGKQKGKDDERHLWPEWFRLIQQCHPAVIFGEQVAARLVVGSSDEGLQQVLRREAANRVSQKFWRGKTGASSTVQAMPAGLRIDLERSKQGETKKGAMDTFAQGEDVCRSVQGRQAGEVFGSGMSSALREERDTFRFGCGTTPNSD